MPTALQKKWHLLPTGRPGHRFRNRYHEHQKSTKRGFMGMLVRFVLAGLCAVIGFILVFIPGPAVVFFLIAGALLATDWLPVARLLDWGEVHVRRIWQWLGAFWGRRSTAARVALGLTGVIIVAAAGFGFYLLLAR